MPPELWPDDRLKATTGEHTFDDESSVEMTASEGNPGRREMKQLGKKSTPRAWNCQTREDKRPSRWIDRQLAGRDWVWGWSAKPIGSGVEAEEGRSARGLWRHSTDEKRDGWLMQPGRGKFPGGGGEKTDDEVSRAAMIPKVSTPAAWAGAVQADGVRDGSSSRLQAAETPETRHEQGRFEAFGRPDVVGIRSKLQPHAADALVEGPCLAPGCPTNLDSCPGGSGQGALGPAGLTESDDGARRASWSHGWALRQRSDECRQSGHFWSESRQTVAYRVLGMPCHAMSVRVPGRSMQRGWGCGRNCHALSTHELQKRCSSAASHRPPKPAIPRSSPLANGSQVHTVSGRCEIQWHGVRRRQDEDEHGLNAQADME
ncbi:hypothetical protein ACCO45_008493 [Purpureocillium lilacinum]|uniref:Uncharacterized protein n=1 Tax=Purpureocillium lilacinum TaxID=33203 RepID=A0ACC4DNG0_PURLI